MLANEVAPVPAGLGVGGLFPGGPWGWLGSEILANTSTGDNGPGAGINDSLTPGLRYLYLLDTRSDPAVILSTKGAHEGPVPYTGTLRLYEEGTGEVPGTTGARTFGASLSVAPTITQEPASTSATEGAIANFSVTAAGTAPLAYQWYFNGVAVSGATSSTYARTTVIGDNGGLVSVIVSNGTLPNATSVNATLTVTAAGTAPTINQQPQAQNAIEGGGATYSVIAVGTAPLSYQWRFNGVPVAGAVSSSYMRIVALADNGGLVSVVVTNTAGSVTSANASLIVTALAGTLITEDGTAKADAESYISVASADVYHASRGNAAWANFTLFAKEAALRNSTDYMVQMYRWRWAGNRKTSTQALDWPRQNVPFNDGARLSYIDSDSVPIAVQRACADLALKASAGDLAPDVGRVVVKDKIDVLETTYAEGASPWVRFRAVDNTLAAYFKAGSGIGVSLVRS